MKKTFLLILAIGFLIFAFLGFKAALKIDQNSPVIQTPTTVDDLIGKQKNLLILHVNDLSSKDAQLVSAWGSFIVYSSPPQLMWVPLFPASTQELTEDIQSKFRLADIGVLDTKSKALFSEQYDLTIDGYILIDDNAYTAFQTWSGSQTDSTTPGILANEKKVLANICRIFKKDGARTFLNKIRWIDLIPSHFSTDLSFETLMLGMDIVKTSGKLDSCEVLLTP